VGNSSTSISTIDPSGIALAGIQALDAKGEKQDGQITDLKQQLDPLQMASGAFVSAGGVWTNASDRNVKENFVPVTLEAILQKIDELPVTEWNYKNEDPSVRHIGPVAQMPKRRRSGR
jgi:hypothetical protein